MFTIKILGVDMEVSGTFDAGEEPSRDCPGYEPSFEIESITHKGEELEVDGSPDDMLVYIEKLVFRAAAEENYEF